MSRVFHFLVKTTVIVLGLSSTSSVMAQLSEPNATLSLTTPEGKVIKVGGSNSRIKANQVYKEHFEGKYPDSRLEFTASGSEQAIADLQKGKIQVAAYLPEKAQGLKKIPIEREKMARYNTLSDGSRYPYSQYRSYVYPASVIAAAPGTTTDEETIESPLSATEATEEKKREFPWWLLLIPLLGGLSWWLGKRNQGKPEVFAATGTPVTKMPPVVPPTVKPAELPKGELTIDATWGNDEAEMNALPSFTNFLSYSVMVHLESEGTWTYGTSDPIYQFAEKVNGNGNVEMADEQWLDQDLRYKTVPPAALVALRNGQFEGHYGKTMTLRLEPGDTVSLLLNDEPGFYKDNTGVLSVTWHTVKLLDPPSRVEG